MTGRHSMFDGAGEVSVPVPVSSSENVMIPVVRAVVTSDYDPDLVLLQRRADPSEAVFGLLELPGGLWRAGESPADEVVREVAEETGVVVSSVSGVTANAIDGRRSIAITKPLAVISGFRGAFPAVHTVLAATGSGVPRGKLGESDDVRWWPIGEVLAEMERHPDGFVPSTLAALEAYSADRDSDSD